jgi:hypothetical protein
MMINRGLHSSCYSPFKVVSLKSFDVLSKTMNKTQNKHYLSHNMSTVPYK